MGKVRDGRQLVQVKADHLEGSHDMFKQFLGPQIHIGRLKKFPFFKHLLLFSGILNWVMVLHLDLLGACKVWLVT